MEYFKLYTRVVQSKRFLGNACLCAVLITAFSPLSGISAGIVEEEGFTNSLGMKMLPIPSGSFVMGTDQRLPRALRMDDSHYQDGDFDEHPHHRIMISRAFFMATTEETNAQYELGSVRECRFSAIFASIFGFPCATYQCTSQRKPLISLI